MNQTLPRSTQPIEPMFVLSGCNVHPSVTPLKATTIPEALDEAGILPINVHPAIREGKFCLEPIGSEPKDLLSMTSDQHFIPNRSIDGALAYFFLEHATAPVGLSWLLALARHLTDRNLPSNVRFVPVDCKPDRIVRYDEHTMIPVLERNSVEQWTLGLSRIREVLDPRNGAFLVGVSTLHR